MLRTKKLPWTPYLCELRGVDEISSSEFFHTYIAESRYHQCTHRAIHIDLLTLIYGFGNWTQNRLFGHWQKGTLHSTPECRRS
jgi:hypothetical protein